METYFVILKDLSENSEEGWRDFLSRFSSAYNMTPDQARSWIRRSHGALYRVDSMDEAERNRAFLEGLGGVVEISQNQPGPIPPDPGPAQPHSTSWISAPGFLSEDEKLLALISHLAAFGGAVFPFANIFIPLAIYLAKKNDSAYIAYHARESLNFQISVSIYAIVSVVLMFVLVGFVLIIALLIFELIVVIMAAVKAGNGEYYQYPLCIRVV